MNDDNRSDLERACEFGRIKREFKKLYWAKLDDIRNSRIAVENMAKDDPDSSWILNYDTDAPRYRYDYEWYDYDEEEMQRDEKSERIDDKVESDPNW